MSRRSNLHLLIFKRTVAGAQSRRTYSRYFRYSRIPYIANLSFSHSLKSTMYPLRTTPKSYVYAIMRSKYDHHTDSPSHHRDSRLPCLYNTPVKAHLYSEIESTCLAS